MRLIWLVNETKPLPKEACRLAVRLLADEFAREIKPDATVIVQDGGAVGAYYPLAEAVDTTGESAWFVDYDAIKRKLAVLAESELGAVGIDPSDASFEMQAMKMLRRRFAHWPEKQLEELAGMLPQLSDLALRVFDEQDLLD